MGPFEKSWREGVALIDMDLGHGGHGTTRQGQTAKKTWVGRDVQSIIIILEADMVHVCAGIHFLRRYLLPVAKLVHAQVPSIQLRPAP